MIGMTMYDILAASRPVLPVLTVANIAWAAPLAAALYRGGIRAVEVTLRTPAALTAIKEMRSAVPELIVGAGTVLNCSQLNAAKEAGAQFAVSPGLSVAVLAAARDMALPFLPGVMTPSEMMAALELDCAAVKLFPAQRIGGAALLQAVSGPFPDLSFCPTGGIDNSSVDSYLALKNVVCVGGSWFLSAQLLERQAWPEIEQAAFALQSLRAATTLR